MADVHSGALEQVPERLLIAPVGAYQPLGWLVSRVPMDFSRWVLQHLLGNIRAARRARLLLRQDAAGFDVVHVHGALAAVLLGRTMRRRAGAALLVYTEHDSTPWSCRYRRRSERVVRRCIYRSVNLRACRAASLVVTNFAELADELATRTRLPRSRFVTVRNVTDQRPVGQRSSVRPPSGQHRPVSVRARHGFERYCLYVGSLVDRKGPDILVRALAEVSTPCIFVGEGPMRAALERLASRAGVRDRVVFTGALERAEVSRYYSAAEALVLPSVSEGVPLVALEALRAGVPVVASNLTGIASVVRHGENGLLVDPGCHASLASALALLESDEALRVGLRLGAKRSGEVACTWSDVVNELCVQYIRQGKGDVVVPRQRVGDARLGAAHGTATAVPAVEPSRVLAATHQQEPTHG